jgi:hypothetical protein
LHDADPDPTPPPPPLPTTLGAALLAWICAATTLAALTLGHSLLGPRGLVVLALLAVSAAPFTLRPRSHWTTLGYLFAGALAALAIPLGWALRVAL